MYRIITGIWVIVIILIALPTDAYTPGPNRILECSGCGQQLISKTIGSIGSYIYRDRQIWTDWYEYFPMKPCLPSIIKCPSCGRILWIVDLKLIGQCRYSETKEMFPNAVYAEKPSEHDFIEAASVKGLAPERELSLRMRALWEANCDFRYERESSVQFSDKQRQSLERLMEILDENDDVKRLFKAELARELGDYDESLRLLSIDCADKHEEFRSRIEKLARAEIREVQEIVKESDK